VARYHLSVDRLTAGPPSWEEVSMDGAALEGYAMSTTQLDGLVLSPVELEGER
jgi:hypothetical protein